MYNLKIGIMATITTEFGKLSSKKQRAVYLLVRDKSNANAFIHPQLGTDNKIVFKDNVPVFHNVQIPYVHQLQNVLHEHNENISIHMQIFKI